MVSGGLLCMPSALPTQIQLLIIYEHITVLRLSFHKHTRWTLVLSSRSQEVKWKKWCESSLSSLPLPVSTSQGPYFPAPWWAGSLSLSPGPLSSFPIPVPLLQPHCHPCCFSNTPSLCTGYSLLWECFSPKSHMANFLSFFKSLLRCHPCDIFNED